MESEYYWELCWNNEDGGSSSFRYPLDHFNSATNELEIMRRENPCKVYTLMLVSRTNTLL